MLEDFQKGLKSEIEISFELPTLFVSKCLSELLSSPECSGVFLTKWLHICDLFHNRKTNDVTGEIWSEYVLQIARALAIQSRTTKYYTEMCSVKDEMPLSELLAMDSQETQVGELIDSEERFAREFKIFLSRIEWNGDNNDLEVFESVSNAEYVDVPLEYLNAIYADIELLLIAKEVEEAVRFTLQSVFGLGVEA